MKFLWKWLICSWLHYKHRCYPTVWGPEQAKEMNILYKPNRWHCEKCHPCGEWIDILLKKYGEKHKENTKKMGIGV